MKPGRMADLHDYELLKSDLPGGEPPLRSRLWLAALLGVAVAVAIAAYVAYRRAAPPAPVVSAVKTPAPPPQPAGPLGGTPEAVVVPPLEESDPIVRELVRKITSHPAVVTWLTTSGLIRNFTVVVSNVAEGPTPA